ncbi:MAG: hypothetical protein GX173_11570 [Ruminococcaceae bacterium]|nr:hypothetical protein [Oscillospiraceae bacterium]
MENNREKMRNDKEKAAIEESLPEAVDTEVSVKPLLHPLLYALLLAVLLAGLTLLALAAGNWLQTHEASPDNSSKISDNGQTLPAAAYERKERLSVGVNDRFDQLNPIYATGDGETDVVALIFEALARINEEGKLIGQLARDWSYTAESSLLTVHLRQDHTFRDGRVVTADDVVYTYSCLLSDAYDGPYKGRWPSLLKVEPGPDAHTVFFHFNEQTTSPDLRMLTVGILKSDYYPYEPDRVFELRDGNLRPEGSGAFYLLEQTANRVVLQLRPGYAGQIHTIDIHQVASDAKFRLLQEGQLDIVRNLWDERMKLRARTLPFYSFIPYATSADSYFMVNPLPDSQKIIQRPSQRLAVLLTVAGKPLSHLQSAALTELEEQPLQLFYFQGVDRDVRYSNQENANKLASRLRSAGLEVTLKATAWPELADRAMHHDYDLLLLPATANSRLPEHSVLLEDQVQPEASALVTAYRQEVLIVCNRLSQVTINPYAYPFAASVGSWTDRVENIRITEPATPEEEK